MTVLDVINKQVKNCKFSKGNLTFDNSRIVSNISSWIFFVSSSHWKRNTGQENMAFQLQQDTWDSDLFHNNTARPSSYLTKHDSTEFNFLYLTPNRLQLR